MCEYIGKSQLDDTSMSKKYFRLNLSNFKINI